MFGRRDKREIEIDLFTDERKNIGDGWNYISTIIIPTTKFGSIYNKLMKHRNNINYHHEMKFAGIEKPGAKLELAKLWLDEILKDEDESIYFKVLGLDTKLLEEDKFGEGPLKKGENYANLYNRFFKVNVFSTKYFFSDFHEIRINKIFHDKEGNLEKHKYFNWHCISRIEEDGEKLKSNFREVFFINSNHKLEIEYASYSQIIQLSDILVGTISHCLHHNSFKESIQKHKGRNELGEKLYPLVERILRKPGNKNSSYKYFKKYDISFFPKEVPSQFKELEQYLHKDKIIEISSMITKKQNQNNGQESLF